jgi:hypothetical protein
MVKNASEAPTGPLSMGVHLLCDAGAEVFNVNKWLVACESACPQLKDLNSTHEMLCRQEWTYGHIHRCMISCSEPARIHEAKHAQNTRIISKIILVKVLLRKCIYEHTNNHNSHPQNL